MEATEKLVTHGKVTHTSKFCTGITIAYLLLLLVQWSMDYIKTTPWDGRKWSYIAGGLLIKG